MPPIPRRTFLAYSLAAGCLASRAFAEESSSAAPARSVPPLPPVNAFSLLKKKLIEGQSATLLLISDSTGYRDISGTRRFIRWLASQYPSHRASEWDWAEWETKAPTGPRIYGEPIVLSEGRTKRATFTILNAVLPGAVAQAMIDGSRWDNMIAPLDHQAPDLVLWNHGHNHQAALGPKDYPYGRGSFLAPLGRVGLEFPNTPHAAIVQNPWRDNDGYERVRDWWLSVAETMPALTLVDGYSPFINQKKSADLYQDSVHPSARGYELIYQQLIAAWESTTPQGEEKAVPTACWANLPRGPTARRQWRSPRLDRGPTAAGKLANHPRRHGAQGYRTHLSRRPLVPGPHWRHAERRTADQHYRCRPGPRARQDRQLRPAVLHPARGGSGHPGQIHDELQRPGHRLDPVRPGQLEMDRHGRMRGAPRSQPGLRRHLPLLRQTAQRSAVLYPKAGHRRRRRA